mgnify:FL=1
MINKNIKNLWLCLACMLSVAYVSAQETILTSPFMASHYGVAIQGACIYSETWNNLPEGELTPMGIYQMEQGDGYDI